MVSEERHLASGGDQALPTQTGAIDSLEREWALIALDDGQRLDWPRGRLPPGAKESMVVELSLHEPCASGALPGEGTWEGTVEAAARPRSPQATIRLGTQRVQWPGAERLATNRRVIVRMQIDPDATEQRRRQVEDLVNDLFG